MFVAELPLFAAGLWAPVVAEIQTLAWQRLKAHVEEHHAGRWPWARAWAVVRDLYRLVAIQDALHAPAADRATPDWLAAYDFLGRVCGVEAVADSKPARFRPERSEVMVLQSDPTLAKRLLGWQSTVTLEEGLERTAAWMRSNLSRFRPEFYAV